jgi:hypothetical protein
MLAQKLSFNAPFFAGVTFLSCNKNGVGMYTSIGRGFSLHHYVHSGSGASLRGSALECTAARL